MEFDVQSFLLNMDRRATEASNKLDSKLDALAGQVDQVIASVAKHETRLVVVEGSRALARWFIAALIVAGLGGLANVAFTYFENATAAVGKVAP